MNTDITARCINTVRMLAAQEVSAAKSGHPGICLGAAPAAYTLFADFLKFDPKDPEWHDRDRFVLSSGHGSAMLYALLHLFGYDVTKTDLESFRQFGSKTPGHPERGVTPGVDASTGPLGQGIAMAVGMALAEAHLAARFNKPDYPVVDHYTYALCGEGCLEEGISYEACSFAGAQKLGKLILLYDKNNISIEGDTLPVFSEDVAMRFTAQGWQALEVSDVNDVSALKKAIAAAKADKTRPSIIICKSVIGYGSPLAGTAAVHGSPLNAEQLESTGRALGYTEKSFETPKDVKEHCANIVEAKAKTRAAWDKLFKEYRAKYPELAASYDGFFGKTVHTPTIPPSDGKKEATRISGGKILNEIAKQVPNLLSGSADLSPSTKTDLKNEGWFSPENRCGRNIHFGIREHAMAAICNGIALHGGLKVVCSTFFTFTDYMKGAMRLSALMRLPVIYVLTHDGIGVGEDGPTHQPIEQLVAIRATPDMTVFRPCDYSETATAYLYALGSDAPTAIVLSRQDLPQYDAGSKAIFGGYAIDDCVGRPDVLLIATGSEVSLCSEAKNLLEKQGAKARVISLPCGKLFDLQHDGYKNLVMPQDVKARVAVETASPLGWREYAGELGEVIAMTSFGASGKAETLYEHFGFTPERIKDCALAAIRKCTK